MKSNNNVLEFIHRRFENDCRWIDGNCYYFAVILKARFPEGSIYYDMRIGHFVFKYHDEYYDWTGIADLDGYTKYLVEWDKFKEFDSIQYKAIIRDCIL